MFSIETRSPAGVTDSVATLSGEVTSLDKSVIDGVMAFFDYGLNSDLSDATTLSGEKAMAVFQDGGGVPFEADLSGLSGETTYYFQARGRSVRYDDIDAMDDVVKSEGFMNDLVVVDSEMDAVANRTFSNAGTMTKWLLGIVLSTMWTVVYASEKFFESQPTEQVDSKGWRWKLWVDLTNVSQVSWYYKQDLATPDQAVDLEDDEGNVTSLDLISNNTSSWTNYTIDLSGYSGKYYLRWGPQGYEYDYSYSFITGRSGGSAMDVEGYGEEYLHICDIEFS